MHPSVRRLGALSLALLLQVFVLSGFIHPCCLDGGGEGGHAAHEAASDAPGVSGNLDAPVHEGHHGTMPAQEPHAHPSPTDRVETGARGHEVPSAVPEPHEAVGGMAHEDDHSCGGCEGNCGLCCQTAGVSFLPGPVHVTERPDAARRLLRPARLGTTILPAPPGFLLPFANAPPSPATVSI